MFRQDSPRCFVWVAPLARRSRGGRRAAALLLGAVVACVASCSAERDTEELSRRVLALAAPSGTLDACVREHIDARGGNPLAVTELSCGVTATTTCAGVGAPDLSPLASLAQLRELDLTGRCIVDVRPIAALAELERLELSRNAIVNIRSVGNLKRLIYLGLADNPVQASWGTTQREPFSELPELTELVLDGTEIDNVLPLAQAKKLQKLSMRRMQALTSLQSLVALRGLRALHVDDLAISDLTALADMTALEELSADGTVVASIEPLRALVERHRLRRVSLRGTCVLSCDALRGISHDCSEPKAPSECYVPEVDFAQYGPQFAVPLPLVERFAPNDLPIWTNEQLGQGYEAAKSAPNIDWKNASSGCDIRATLTAALLRDSGFPDVTRVLSYGNLRLLSSHAPFGFYWFDFHVAVAVRARVGATTGFFVIDPTLDESKPMRLADWYARQIDSTDGSLDFECQRYTDRHGIGPCDDVADAEGNLHVDPLGLLRGVVCQDTACIPRF